MSREPIEGALARRPLVMVVEDDDDLREVLCETLDVEGFEPLPHKNPSRALRAIANGAMPAAIVLDYGLPGIGGAGFLSRLRTSGEPPTDCPVLLLTGWENMELLGLAVECLMAKPADPTELVQAIRRLIDAPTVAKGFT
jgi:DNA-binding response OmpR family regulator